MECSGALQPSTTTRIISHPATTCLARSLAAHFFGVGEGLPTPVSNPTAGIGRRVMSDAVNTCVKCQMQEVSSALYNTWGRALGRGRDRAAPAKQFATLIHCIIRVLPQRPLFCMSTVHKGARGIVLQLSITHARYLLWVPFVTRQHTVPRQ